MWKVYEKGKRGWEAGMKGPWQEGREVIKLSEVGGKVITVVEINVTQNGT